MSTNLKINVGIDSRHPTAARRYGDGSCAIIILLEGTWYNNNMTIAAGIKYKPNVDDVL